MVFCLELSKDLERMASELRDISDVGDEAQSDHNSREVNPRLRKTQLNRFLFDTLQTAIVDRYQKLKETTVAPIRDGKLAAAGHDFDQGDGYF